MIVSMLSFAYKGSDHTDVKFSSALDAEPLGNRIAQRVGDMWLCICLLLGLFFGF